MHRANKVLIFEPHANGHHGPYLHWMAVGLAERGFEVTIVTLTETMVHPCMLALAKAEPNAHYGGGALRVVATEAPIALPSGAMGGIISLATREWAYWRLFHGWYRAHAAHVRPDVVFLPCMDYCLYIIGLFGSPFDDCPWVSLAMRPSFQYRSMGILAPRPAFAGVKRALFFRVLHNQHLKQLLTIDEPLAHYLADISEVAGKVSFFPEPAELGDLPAPAEAKRMFGVASERKVILLFGAISGRKGVFELVRALASPRFPPMVDVLLAGKVQEPAIRELLAEAWVRTLYEAGRLKVIDRFIEPTEEPALFAAADIVWAGYRGHYNASGILVQAAKAGCPLLACEEGVIGWQTRRHGLGRTVNPTNPAEVCAAVAALLTEGAEKPADARSVSIWSPPSFSEAQDALAYALSDV